MTTIRTVKQMDELVDMGESLAWHQKWRMKLSALFHQVTLTPGLNANVSSHSKILFVNLNANYLVSLFHDVHIFYSEYSCNSLCTS